MSYVKDDWKKVRDFDNMFLLATAFTCQSGSVFESFQLQRLLKPENLRVALESIRDFLSKCVFSAAKLIYTTSWSNFDLFLGGVYVYMEQQPAK